MKTKNGGKKLLSMVKGGAVVRETDLGYLFRRIGEQIFRSATGKTWHEWKNEYPLDDRDYKFEIVRN